jgi:phage gp29-like protein
MAEDIITPEIHLDAKDRIYMDLRRKLFPTEIEGILSSAMDGSIYYQDLLFQIMFDTWPRLQKNLRELTQVIVRLGFKVEADKPEDGEEPTTTATERAELLERAIKGFAPDIVKRERTFDGLVRDIATTFLTGITVSEILWEVRDTEYMPRASIRVPARYYRFPYNMDEPDQLMMNPSGDFGDVHLEAFPRQKFVISVYEGHTGHPVVSAPMRVLAAWWAAQRFGLEWFMTNAQLFGIPFRKGTFTKGDKQAFDLLCQMLKNMGTAGWAALPEGTSLEFMTAGGTGGEGPAERLMHAADTVCDVLLLGQTLTTDVADSGSRALGDVHAEVKDAVVRTVAGFAAEMLNSQFVNTLITLNYGEPIPQEVPKLVPDFEDVVDEMAQAQRAALLFGKGTGQLALPIKKDWLYKHLNIPEPEDEIGLFEPTTGAMPPTNDQSGLNGLPGASNQPLFPANAAVHAFNPSHDKKGEFSSNPDPTTGATHDSEGVLKLVLKNHGETKDFRESGFVLPNGKMPDMSAGVKGSRNIHHEEVKLFSKDKEDELYINPDQRPYKTGLMLNAGAVRISHDENFGGVINAGPHPLTGQQKSNIKHMIDHHDGKMYVEVNDKDDKLLHDGGYDKGTSHLKIFGDIARAQRGEKINSSASRVST